MPTKPISEMTAQELEAALKEKQAVEKPAARPSDEVEVPCPDGVGVLAEGLFECKVIGACRVEQSASGNPKLVFEIEITDGEFTGETGELHTSPAIGARYLRALAVNVVYKDGKLRFDREACAGVPCKVQWTASQAGFIRPNAIYPLDYEPRGV